MIGFMKKKEEGELLQKCKEIQFIFSFRQLVQNVLSVRRDTGIGLNVGVFEVEEDFLNFFYLFLINYEVCLEGDSLYCYLMFSKEERVYGIQEF